jgi:glucokinase
MAYIAHKPITRDSMMTLTPAIDLGGTFAKGAIVDEAGTILYEQSVPTDREAGPRAVIDRMGDFAASLVDRVREQTGDNPPAFGFASPGIVDETAGVAVFSANIGWRDVPLRSILAERIGIPVVLSHDVRAGGVAEAVLGAGRDSNTVLVVPVGTGIAGALIVDGQPYRGGHGASMELGHIPVPGFNGPCPCGRRGCLERYSSASAIGERYREAVADSGLPVLADADSKLVGELTAAGDPIAAQVWDSAIAALGDALVTASTLLDPDLIVIAGGLSLAGDALLEPLQIRFDATPPLSGAHIEIRAAQLGNQAGVMGAAYLAAHAG